MSKHRTKPPAAEAPTTSNNPTKREEQAYAEIARLKGLLIVERITSGKIQKVLCHRIDDLEKINDDLRDAALQNIISNFRVQQ